jgi:hypothetical protein
MIAQLVERRSQRRYPFVEESKVFSLFQISLQNYYDLRAALLKYSHLQPSEMDRMPFFELEELLDSLKMLNEKEEEERKKQESADKAGVPNLNINSMSRQLSNNSSTPKLPNFNL